jgi:sec-independent protein translocase protein TatA
MPELLIILAVVVIVFGGSRLPQLGEALGKTTRNFRKAVQKPEDEAGASQPKGDEKP